MTNGIGRTVLVVEDDQALRKLVTGILETRGYRVLPAAGGDEAIAAAGSFREEIHLLLTDFALGGMNGLELAARIAGSRPGIGILIISGYSEIPLPPGLGNAMGAKFLAKPFTLDSLLEKVAGILKPSLPGTGPLEG